MILSVLHALFSFPDSERNTCAPSALGQEEVYIPIQRQSLGVTPRPTGRFEFMSEICTVIENQFIISILVSCEMTIAVDCSKSDGACHTVAFRV